MSFLREIGSFALAIAAAYTGNFWYFAASTGLSAYNANREKSKFNRGQRERFNASLKDRFEMLDLQPDAPRSLVLGRLRYVEGVRDRWTSGTNEEKLTMIVSFAGHEIDAFEQWYLDDKPVTLDGDGWVTTAPWYKTNVEAGQLTGSIDGSGGAVVTLPSGYVSGSATAAWQIGSGDNYQGDALTLSVVGSTATMSGGPIGAGAVYWLNFNVEEATSAVRIRPYLGTTTQTVGADLAAEYPGKIDATDDFANIALAVVDMLYNPDVFPQGRATVTALMRGAKCYDPRDASTAWTENPALHALKYATWYSGWNLRSADYLAADIETAADVCDVSTDFELTATGGGTTTVTLPRYACGIAIPADADHESSMASIIETMNGRAGWAGGVWRLRAGAMGSSVFTMDDDWLVNNTSGGIADEEPVITAVQSIQRDLRYNRVTGSCVDPDQRYQLLPFPAVEDSVLIAAKGERPLDVEYAGVTHIAHAQHLASMAIRAAQAGLRIEATCGEHAADLELFDVGTINIDEYGYSGKTVEVIGWTWSQMRAYTLHLNEITAALFTVDAELTGRDPAPDSAVKAPWDVEDMGALTVTSGTAALTDSGSVITRTQVSWSAAVGENIRNGGRVEVQYTEATDTLPSGDWPLWEESGAATSAVIPGLNAGRFYLFRARFVQTLPRVRGKWSELELHQVGSIRSATIYRQTSAPSTGVQDGDEWYDTDDNNKHYVRDGGVWVSVRDAGKIRTFYATGAPTAEATGDLWFDTDDNNKQYRWSGSAWVSVRDAGKTGTFYATSAPTAEAVGDLWFDTDDGNKVYRWSGSAWVAVPIGTGGLTPEAATEVVDNFKASLSQTFTTSIFGLAQIQINDTLSYTNTTGGTVKVEVTLAAAHSLTVSGASSVSANGMYIDGTINGTPLTYTDPPGFDASSIAPAATATWRIANGYQLSMSSGDVLSIRTLLGLQGTSGATGTVNTSNALLKVVVLKR